MSQVILSSADNYCELDEWIKEHDCSSVLLVCGRSIDKLDIGAYFDNASLRLGISIVRFSDFSPNPVYESVLKGVETYRRNKCNAIIGVGGGSAMDVAKCIKYEIHDDIPLLAVPTTAGSGAEATHFAVFYQSGIKRSFDDEMILPDAVLLNSAFLSPLPLYQKKSTLLDALCHAIESYWSKSSCEESRAYSTESIMLILDNMNDYLSGDASANEQMMKAAYLAGNAINITKTTAGHALCYKITTLFGLAHGHAAALCVKEVWRWMIADHDLTSYEGLSKAFGCSDINSAFEKYCSVVDDLGLEIPSASDEQIEEMVSSVNIERLENNPFVPDKEAVRSIYKRIMR